MIYGQGTRHSRGVLVLISDQLQCGLKSVKCDENGRFILVEALIQESPYILLNLYTPTKQNEQWAFYEKISTTLDEMIVDPQSQIIIGGDFNVPAYPIERSVIEPNRKPIVRLGSVVEHDRTHNKIWSIELNRTFDYRTVNNRTQSNVQLPNNQQSNPSERLIIEHPTIELNGMFDYRTPVCLYCGHFVRCTVPLLLFWRFAIPRDRTIVCTIATCTIVSHVVGGNFAKGRITASFGHPKKKCREHQEPEAISRRPGRRLHTSKLHVL